VHYDVIVIGAGSGNSILDQAFADKKCALVQTGTFGGTCLNVGCIPTKMFVYPADLASYAATDGPRLGVDTSFNGVDWSSIRDRIFGRIDAIEAGGRDYRRRNEWAELYEGAARFTGPKELTIALDSGGEATITGDQIVIATGARPMIPAIPGLDEVEFHTSDTIMRLDVLPERMAILGGGFIGCEFAHVFSSYGVEVTQIHRHPALLNHHDDDIARRFTEVARGEWGLRLDSQIERVAKSAGGIEVHVACADGTREVIEVDSLLIATGRTPNTDTLDVATAGITTNAKGVITVSPTMGTGVDGIWALGDVAHTPELKHVANHEARVVRHNLLHPDAPIEADHRFVPSAVFTHPQIASVGLTERDARAAGIDVAIKDQAFGDTAYGWAMEDKHSFVKLIGDRATGKLIGAHLMGPHAGSLIQPLIMAMSLDLPVAGLARSQYWIHPALAEVVENALLGLEDALTQG
jgi:mycothione reductase